ncbi:MAG: carboxylating nicotinate-nucleotide diphosphorylase [Candidatus Firestonebacteria bacterium]
MGIKQIIHNALREDIGKGDITSIAIIPCDLNIKAIIVARENGKLAGLNIAKEVFKIIDKKIKFNLKVKEGSYIKSGQVLAEIFGQARSILSSERVALNFLQRLSGITTLTDKFVKKIKSSKIKILDTRKTTPNLRLLEKYAVKMGGGFNHRFGLFDGMLIKDNHIQIAGGINNAIEKARKKYPKMKIEVEAQSLKEVKESLKANFNVIMLDNMNIPDLRKAIKLINGKYKIEVSGGVRLNNISKISQLKIDYISIGALTHSAKSLNMSLDIK